MTNSYFDLLESSKPNREKIREILAGMKKAANDIFEKAQRITLVGATPFARCVFENREKLFGDCEVHLVDTQSEIEVGGYSCSAHVQMPVFI